MSIVDYDLIVDKERYRMYGTITDLSSHVRYSWLLFEVLVSSFESFNALQKLYWIERLWSWMTEHVNSKRWITIPSCSDGRMTQIIENHRKFLDGQKMIADSWTTARRSTSPTAQPGTSGTSTETPSYWNPMMISTLNRYKREKISSPPDKISQLFNENKDDKTSKSRGTKERAQDHSMKHCE